MVHKGSWTENFQTINVLIILLTAHGLARVDGIRRTTPPSGTSSVFTATTLLELKRIQLTALGSDYALRACCPDEQDRPHV